MADNPRPNVGETARVGKGEESKSPNPQEAPGQQEGPQSDLEARVRELETTLAATRAALPLSLIPEHGAGPGMEVSETWSLAEQEEAFATGVNPQ